MPGLLRGVARTAVVAGTATAVSGRVQRRQQGRWAQQEQQAAPPPAPEPAPVYAQQPPPPPAGDDMDAKLEQLRQLGDLKAQGVLSQEEFDAQKSRILSG